MLCVSFHFQVFRGNGVLNVVPVLTGLANTYTDYVVTFEEYQVSQILNLLGGTYRVVQ